MIERTVTVLTSGLKNHLGDRAFWLIHSLFILLLGLLVFLFWPEGEMRSPTRPLRGEFYTFALLAGGGLVALLVYGGLAPFRRDYTVTDWLRFTEFHPPEIVCGRVLLSAAEAIVLIATTIPLGLLIVYSGGIAPGQFLYLHARVFALIMAIGWQGSYIREMLGHRPRMKAITLVIIYIGNTGALLGVYLLGNDLLDPRYHSSAFIISSLLIIDMCFDLRSLLFQPGRTDEE